MISNNTIQFYFDLFEMKGKEQEEFSKIYSKLKNIYSDSYRDKTIPFNEESFIKACIFTIYINSKKTKYYNEQEYNLFLKKLYTQHKGELLFGKNNTPLLSLTNVLKAIKSFISSPQIRNEPEFKLPNKHLEEYSQSRNYWRKLNDFFSHFFENSENNFKLKKAIWAAFIYLKAKIYGDSKNLLQGFYLLVYIYNILVTKIPNKYFPISLKINDENKSEIIQKIVFQIAKLDLNLIKQDDINQVNNEFNQINIETLNYSNADNYINIFYTKYNDEYILKKDIFDERILFYDIFSNIASSPKKINQFLSPSNINTCARELFSNQNENKNHFMTNLNIQPKNQNINCMTPFTRVVTLKKWAKNYINDYTPNFVLNLQGKYSPKYNYNEELKPISNYINKILGGKFQELLSFYRVKLVTNLEERTKLCLKFIENLLKKDENIFTEEFCAMLLYNETFIKAMIAISFEIVLFIEDIEEIPFNKIYENIDLDIYDFWKIINPSQNHSTIFHKEIKNHLDEIEYQILSFLIWRNPSSNFKNDIHQLLNQNQEINEQLKIDLEKLSDFEFTYQSLFLLHNKNDFLLDFIKKGEDNQIDIFKKIRDNIKSYPNLNGISIFLIRVINYCNLLNKTIFKNLGLSNEIAFESEKFLKSILISEEYIKIIFNHHIDQFVICVIITILKINNLFKEENLEQEKFDFKPKISIENLINNYQKSKQDQSIFQKIFTQVKINDTKYISLMEFYKEYFLKTFNSFITNFKSEKEESEKEIYPTKKRKLSEGLQTISHSNIETKNKNSFQEILSTKSAFSNKVENYEPIIKKIEKQRLNYFFDLNFNEFDAKRTQRLKEIYPDIINYETKNLNTNKRTNPIFRKTFGKGTLFTHPNQQLTPDCKKEGSSNFFSLNNNFEGLTKNVNNNNNDNENKKD